MLIARAGTSIDYQSRLLGETRVGFVRVSLNSELKLVCLHGDDRHGFHNDRYS